MFHCSSLLPWHVGLAGMFSSRPREEGETFRPSAQIAGECQQAPCLPARSAATQGGTRRACGARGMTPRTAADVPGCACLHVAYHYLGSAVGDASLSVPFLLPRSSMGPHRTGGPSKLTVERPHLGLQQISEVKAGRPHAHAHARGRQRRHQQLADLQHGAVQLPRGVPQIHHLHAA